MHQIALCSPYKAATPATLPLFRNHRNTRAHHRTMKAAPQGKPAVKPAVSTRTHPPRAATSDHHHEKMTPLQLAEHYGLNVDLAVNLSIPAFRAYSPPKTDQGIFMDRSTTTEISYFDKDYLSMHVQGLLKVDLQSAQNLADEDPVGKSDPFVTVSIGDSTYRSKTHNDTLDPKWHETCYLFVRDLKKQELTVTVNDDDTISGDDPLASFTYKLDGLAHGKPQEVDKAGIKLTLQYLPMKEVLAPGTRRAAPFSSPGFPKLPVQEAWGTRENGTGDHKAVPKYFLPVAYVHSTTIETQVWVLINRDTRDLCLAWRGTEPSKLQDILTDIAFTPVDFRSAATSSSDDEAKDLKGSGPPPSNKVKDLKGSGPPPSNKAKDLKGSGPPPSSNKAKDVKATVNIADVKQVVEAAQDEDSEVHRGFQNAYEGANKQVNALVEELTSEGNAPWTVYVTGHSLGGALATMSAYEMATKRWKHGKKLDVVMYNYGSPRVGNTVFVEDYNDNVPNSWRIANDDDAVTKVPFLLGYAHAGHCLRLEKSGISKVQDNGDHDECTEVPDMPHDGKGNVKTIAKKVLDADDSDKVLEKMAEREKGFLDSLLDAAGLSMIQHAGPYYEMTLKKLQEIKKASKV